MIDGDQEKLHATWERASYRIGMANSAMEIVTRDQAGAEIIIEQLEKAIELLREIYPIKEQKKGS